MTTNHFNNRQLLTIDKQINSFYAWTNFVLSGSMLNLLLARTDGCRTEFGSFWSTLQQQYTPTSGTDKLSLLFLWYIGMTNKLAHTLTILVWLDNYFDNLYWIDSHFDNFWLNWLRFDTSWLNSTNEYWLWLKIFRICTLTWIDWIF